MTITKHVALCLEAAARVPQTDRIFCLAPIVFECVGFIAKPRNRGD
jgi:hypothetical protein